MKEKKPLHSNDTFPGLNSKWSTNSQQNKSKGEKKSSLILFYNNKS